jgi:hypothetical protein
MTQSHVDQSTIRMYKSDSKPYGITFGSWTVKWWQWALLTPASIGAVADESGKNWNINQPPSNVWFLAGNFGNPYKKFPHRIITLPPGRSILFPVVNCEVNPLEYPELRTDDDLVKQVLHDVDTVVKLDCFINGIRVTPIRISSDPQVFPLTIDKDNAFGVKGGGFTHATADGFWVFLEPLPAGHYAIDFEGSCELGRLNAGARYKVTVSSAI